MNPTFDDAQIDDAIWGAIVGSHRCEDFIDYINHLPDGRYVEEAFAVIDRISDVNGHETDESIPEVQFSQAVKAIEAMAESGDVTARFHMGKLLIWGRGIPCDPEAGEKWYSLAAMEGDIRSRFNLAVRLVGDQTPERVERGQIMLEALAAEGFADAMAWIAKKKMLAATTRVEETEAFHDLLEATEIGSSWACLLISSCFEDGRGVRRDQAEAIKWLVRSADAGDNGARRDLASRYQSGKGVPKNLTRAYSLLRAGAVAGDLECQAYLANLLLDEQNPDRNSAEGVRWLRRAAVRGSAWAQYNLAVAFFRGQDALRNEKEGLKWVIKAAANGLPEAQCWLGDIQREAAKPGSPELEEARNWFRKAAEQGHPGAQFRLARELAESGDSELPKFAEAIKWYRLAAIQGQSSAWVGLGYAIRQRQGATEADQKKAIEYFRRAAEEGSGAGQFALAELTSPVMRLSGTIPKLPTGSPRRWIRNNPKPCSGWEQCFSRARVCGAIP